MLFIRNIFRYLVGLLFIFSGFIKIVDPKGTAYKFEDYFLVFSDMFGSFFEVFTPAALFFSVLLTSLEIILGVALLMLFRIRTTAWSLLAIIFVFTVLTFFSATTCQPSDCGCFGDFMKLSPCVSYIKDLVLMGMILVIFMERKKFESKTDNKIGVIIMAIVTLVTVFFAKYNIDHLPFIDFRAYKVGNNIKEKLTDGKEDVRADVFVYKNLETNDLVNFSQDSLMKTPELWEKKEKWEYVERKEIIVEKGMPSSIMAFSVLDDDLNEVGDQLLIGKQMLLVVRHTEKFPDEDIEKMNSIITKLSDIGVNTTLLWLDAREKLSAFEKQLTAPHTTYITFDKKDSKTMIRAEAGVVLLNDATIIGKWNVIDMPETADVIKLIE